MHSSMLSFGLKRLTIRRLYYDRDGYRMGLRGMYPMRYNILSDLLVDSGCSQLDIKERSGYRN